MQTCNRSCKPFVLWVCRKRDGVLSDDTNGTDHWWKARNRKQKWRKCAFRWTSRWILWIRRSTWWSRALMDSRKWWIQSRMQREYSTPSRYLSIFCANRKNINRDFSFQSKSQVNVVVMKNVNDMEIGDFIEMTKDRVRSIFLIEVQVVRLRWTAEITFSQIGSSMNNLGDFIPIIFLQTVLSSCLALLLSKCIWEGQAVKVSHYRISPFASLSSCHSEGISSRSISSSRTRTCGREFRRDSAIRSTVLWTLPMIRPRFVYYIGHRNGGVFRNRADVWYWYE